MTPAQISLVKSTWQQVLPIQDTAAQLFYNKLFELDPALRIMFKGNMTEQGRKLMTMITMVVNSLGRLEQIIGAVEDMGRRHVDYGVRDHHYDTVGAALIWTLSQGLGSAFTAEVKDAWTGAYTILATTMKQAAHATA
jgi:hemoglobin-like flavoprotein